MFCNFTFVNSSNLETKCIKLVKILIMHITRINVKNFRMLKNFSIDLEKDLSLVIGKNNVGKTSLLLVIDKFLSADTSFDFNDFNLDFQNEIISLIQGGKITEENFIPKSIKMQLIIKYDENDSLENIGNILLNLDSDNFYLALNFEYLMSYDSYLSCLKKYNEEKTIEKFVIKEWLRHNCKNFFKIVRKSLCIDKNGCIDENKKSIDLDKKNFPINKFISFEFISARRDVDNKDRNKTLSKQTAIFYKTQIDNSNTPNPAMDKLRVSLIEQDDNLTQSYNEVFEGIIDKVSKFGGIYPEESSITICSSLQEKKLLEDNTTVIYNHGNSNLPESYNGLGYMNLISMIFEIEIIKKKFERNGKPADINLLFIEEPEAHTHPQMQYIFIKNIKDLLKEGIVCESEKKPLQSIISTHSAQIVSSCDNFDDIKYLYRKNDKNETEAKKLSDLKVLYGGEENTYYKFLKQYLTINRSELFFADKVICIEGDTERILLPAMMKKIDEDMNKEEIEKETKVKKEVKKETPLLSQNISIIETGAHAEIFEKFFGFIGFKKILIITDFDCCIKTESKDNDESIQAAKYNEQDNMITSNTAIKIYTKIKESNKLCKLSFEDKLFSWDDNQGEVIANSKGNILLCFQTKENNYQPRSFEDAFFITNKKFTEDNYKKFSPNALKPRKIERAIAPNYDAYQIAECVNSKAAFAVELLLNSDENFGNWNIPAYIKEGLTWLRK